MKHHNSNMQEPSRRSNYGMGLTGEGEQEIAGCRRLWSAVLRASAHDAWFGVEVLQRQALRWFKSNDDHVGSCSWICQVLDLDLNAVRQRVGA